ncbi:MAG: SIS domain-containing protein [Anaerolineales bacterium]
MNHNLQTLLQKHPELSAISAELERAAEAIVACFRAGGKVLICGNGGSAADAEHLVGELMKSYLAPRPVPEAVRRALAAASPEYGPYLAEHLQGALPAISLVSQVGLLTAIANDIAGDMIFAQQVYGYGRPGDLLIAISTSGNSRNILRAAEVARALDMRVLGFTNRSGGALAPLCTVCVRAPADRTADVQEYHLATYHALCALVEEALFVPGGANVGEKAHVQR